MFSPGTWYPVDNQSVRLRRPDLGYVLVGHEAAERFAPAGEDVGSQEVGEMHPELVVAFVVEAFDGHFLDGLVHPVDVTIGPGWLGLVSRCSMSFAWPIMSKRI